ncbi:tricarballylate utilization protein B [Cupriavidus sp. USMAA2-4]|uniref:tricarballylate utilization 4Fe-4S protein TcuB n=1 Tax=Cupriavidus sp. USMAA2-4 TaxID=876364 RepID=UPI0008A6D5DD|nr:tricarballylate utilization 4Fe-4S protein TcuB [Cupriavidus sp. USMAA2-4]AOY92610.1 tricarballylate utilization protein B [Cupriavidus sp. USMAA2-4]
MKQPETLSAPATLSALTREAQALAQAPAEASAPRRVIRVLPLTENEEEVARQMQICNACRYCEGFCAVFPAMTRRLEFGKADIHYLANLCHNCGACYHACQYAPPHDFGVNVPQAMARVRGQTYADYAWPPALGALYKRNGLTVALALAAGLALFLLLALARHGTLRHAPLAGDFYAIFPHNLMAAMFGAVFAFALLALALGVTRFWRSVSPGRAGAPALAEAAHDALTLTYLDGGHGEGCNEEDDRFTLARRRFHHCTFYGFLLCFAATAAATLYHYAFGWHAPYAYLSAPVLLGTIGGVALSIGSAGLLWLNLRRDPARGDAAQRPMDRGFIALLLLTALSGLALLAGRDSGAMAALLAVHLGVVMALFATLPYGKFAHGIYRSAALLKSAIEKRQPDTLKLGSD